MQRYESMCMWKLIISRWGLEIYDDARSCRYARRVLAASCVPDERVVFAFVKVDDKMQV